MLGKLKSKLNFIIENVYMELVLVYTAFIFIIAILGINITVYIFGGFVLRITGGLLDPLVPIVSTIVSLEFMAIFGVILFTMFIVALTIIRARKGKFVDGILLFDIFANYRSNFKTSAGITIPIIFIMFLVFYMIIRRGYYGLYALDILVVIGSMIISLTVIAYTIQINKIMDNIENIGRLEGAIYSSGGVFLFTQIALKMLSSTDKNIKEAIDEQLKSERLKTELITNISHDLKTPLTSIINYTDLLKKHDTKDEEIKEYVEVLDRNSHRLKVLITDLVYASKAETGNVDIDLDTLELNELVFQVYGEFDYLFSQKEITFVFDPIEDIYVLADSNHLGRVLINIVDNAIKYSQEGTRIYATTRVEGEYTSFSLKNISKEKLNISPDELMEQFVRGERSRHTEGSGLGLYISRSLMELMGGKLSLGINGDLFEVKLLIPSVENKNSGE
ncbi:MAG: HAMP domain-containing histidine kinase [Tissierella sp.]|nr:HAMP domain-containing histidine kinase [Tissierella sp.]